MTNKFWISTCNRYVCNDLDNCLNAIRKKSNIRIRKIKNEIEEITEEITELVKESKRLKRMEGTPTSY
jgi:predicted RNA-binding protein YlxR (DUF448 family)